MSDPTGLLARPFRGTVHEEWQVSGTAYPDDHVTSLETLVETMDQRIAALPSRRDQVDIGEGCPLIFYILEEYPGLLRAAAADGGDKRGGRVDRIKLLVARLISEGRKAGIRLVLLAQRFEVAIVDGFTRDQFSVHMSFRVGNATSIEMLHPSGRTAAEEHAISPPGVALLTAPGVPLVRLKSPYLGRDNDDTAYGRYWDLICTHAARLTANAR
jgi:S-DNA-T family DNA segregation ATPase FtsK/SpoIIIE